uniref:Uncharacterized protein n=1 Tax=Arundo donax TaxID=35708 RepID=A0A0A9C3C9_ARUDO
MIYIFLQKEKDIQLK